MKTLKIKTIFSLLLTFFISITAFLLLQPSLKVNAAESGADISGALQLYENELPKDLRNIKKGDDLSGKYIFFSSEWMPEGFKNININDGAINVEDTTFNFYISEHSIDITYDLIAGNFYLYKMPENITVTKISATSDASETSEITATDAIKVSDTFDGVLIHEIAETDLPADLKVIEEGDDLSGKYIFFSLDWFASDSSALLNLSPGDIALNSTGITLNCLINNYSSVNTMATFNIESGKIYYYQLPDIGLAGTTMPETAEVFKISDTFTGITEPEENTDDKTDIGDWFNDLGNTISDWLGENVGLTVSGSAVLVIGGIILFFIIFRKRR